MRSTTQLAIAWVLSLPLLACGGAVQPEPGVSPKDAPRLLAPAICAQAYRCCTMAQLMKNDNAGTDVASCETKTQMALGGQVNAIESSERKGRVNYDGLKVQACIDYLSDANTMCSDLNMTFHLTGVPACSSFLEPKVAVGGACTLDFECIDGFCDTTGAASGADGKCRALGKQGDSCANTGRCEAGLDCDATAMTCAVAPTTPPAGGMCFYSSGCSTAGRGEGGPSLLGLGLMVAELVRRRRRADTRPRA
jgi:uncharacterized protein (TIGR03382 family)